MGLTRERLFDAAEEAVYKEYYEALVRDFDLKDTYTRELAQGVCLCYVRLIRALKGGSAEDIYKIDCLLSGNLAKLKAAVKRRKKDRGNLTYEEWRDGFWERLQMLNKKKET